MKPTIIFSIDDGRKDAYRLVKEVLEPLEIPATFNITTKWIREESPAHLTKDELIEIAENPLFEIANHSDTHTNEYDDIKKCFDCLCEWLGLDKDESIGFASPGSDMSLQYAREHREELKKIGVKYMRSCEEDFFNREEHITELTSYAVIFPDTLDHLKSLAHRAIDENLCLVYLMHSVLKPGDERYGGVWTYDFDKFNELARYIKGLQNEGKLDIMTTMDFVTQRQRETKN